MVVGVAKAPPPPPDTLGFMAGAEAPPPPPTLGVVAGVAEAPPPPPSELGVLSSGAGWLGAVFIEGVVYMAGAEAPPPPLVTPGSSSDSVAGVSGSVSGVDVGTPLFPLPGS